MNVTMPPPAAGELPDEIDVAEFTLVLHGHTPDTGEALAEEIRLLIAREFLRRSPILSQFYSLEIEEWSVEHGSRRSANKGRLRRRKDRRDSPLWRFLGRAAVVAGLLSTDVGQIEENMRHAYRVVAEVMAERGEKVDIDPVEFTPIDPELFRRRRRPRGEEPE